MLVGDTLCTLLFISTLIGTIDNLVHGNTTAVSSTLFGTVLFAAFTALFFFGANRLMCSVWREDDCICRAGLFGGFYKSVAIKNVQQVVIRRMWRECDFICLIDGSQGAFDRARKDSYICFPYTEENVKFLRTFWDGDVEEMKDTDYV